ncbi:MAG TPA: hypothetical protein VGC67_15515 [Cellulomonas sp.]
MARYERQLLLGGRWLPVTQYVAFFRADPQRCVEVMTEHWAPMYRRRFGALPRHRVVRGAGLEGLLEHLLPLRSIEEDKHLFLPTRHPEWTALFTDRRQSAGGSIGGGLQERGVETVVIADSPNADRRPRGWRAPVGYRYFSWGVPCEPWTASNGVSWSSVTSSVRVAVDDNGRWEFLLMSSRGGGAAIAEGMPAPVGVVWDESARLTPNRFTHEHLRLACERLGLFPFDADFYAPEGWGLVLERADPAAAEQVGFTLAQARGEEPDPPSDRPVVTAPVG